MKIAPSLPIFQQVPELFHTQTPLGQRPQPPSPAEDQIESTQLAKLRATDRKVRAHEQAHAAAAGGLAKGGPQFTFERGPDGKQYAVAGEVSLDTSAVPGDPEATLRKAQRIRAAALAPADPSPQDRAVASKATAMEAQAKQELQQQEAESNGSRQASDVPTLPRIDVFA